MGVRRTRKGIFRFIRHIAIPLLFIGFPCFIFTSMSFGQVQTQLKVIRASSLGQEVDPSLKELHNELKTLFSFTSYRLLKEENLTLTLNQPVSITAREGRIVWEATLVGLHRGVAEVRIRVSREGKETLNTQVRLFPGRTVLVGGPRIQDGVIIYALHSHF
ncbi:MAG: hypothetical protein ACPL6D_14380 [Thermodesulfobacteriota bacterium]